MKRWSRAKAGRCGSGRHIVWLGCWQPKVALWDCRVLMAAVSVLVELFMFICPYQTRAL